MRDTYGGLMAPSAHGPVRLTHEELDRFAHLGFLVVDRPVVAPDELEEVRALLEGLFAEFDRLPREFAYDLGDVKHHDGPQQIPEINRTSTFAPRLSDTVAFARCRDLATQILGDRAECVWDHAICKPPDGDATIDWHQDLAYNAGTDDPRRVHVWLPLQDTTPDNGCMQYIADDGCRGLVPHGRRGGSIDAHARVAEEVDPSGAVMCPVDAGMVTIHRPTTLHSSGPNATGVPRLAWILIFSLGGPARPTVRMRTAFARVGRSLLRRS